MERYSSEIDYGRLTLGSTPTPTMPLFWRIDEILFNRWDPIGVNKYGDDARDEYESYVPAIVRMLNAGSGFEDIFWYLQRIESQNMGICRSPVTSLDVAMAISKLH